MLFIEANRAGAGKYLFVSVCYLNFCCSDPEALCLK
jgi:hypothetical protein